MSATLVSSIPLPLRRRKPKTFWPTNRRDCRNRRPRRAPKEEPKAIPIPAPEAKLKGPRETTQKKPPPKEVAKVEDNKIPFGQGGPVSGPYGAFTAGATKGGLSFSGGTGDFGSRFGWYVDAVRRKVSENWLKYEIDPNVDTARRVYIYFEIDRSGQPATSAWSSRAGFRRSISRRCARCNASILSARCRRSTTGVMSQWSFGSITSDEVSAAALVAANLGLVGSAGSSTASAVPL